MAALEVGAAEMAAAAAMREAATGFQKAGATPQDAAAKAAELTKSEKAVAYKKASRTAGILFAHDTLAAAAMFQIMTARYADGT